MKELDLLLERFLERSFEALNDERLDCLEMLLDTPDQDLLNWLTGAAEPRDEDLAEIARWIRRRIAFWPGGSENPCRHR